MPERYPRIDLAGLNEPLNAIATVNGSIKKSGAAVTIVTSAGRQTMYLLEVRSRSSLLEDFLKAYGSELEQLAMKVIGDKVEWNTFGVLYDSELRMIFAFNMILAKYDSESCCVVYKEPQQVLADIIEKNVKTTELTNVPPVKLPTRPGGAFGRRQRIVFRYAIVEPKQDFKPPNQEG